MRELLVIADRETGKQLAFHHALEIAKNTGAVIEFVGFVHAPGVDSSEILTHEEKRKVRYSYLDKKQAEMDTFLESVDLAGVKLKVDVVWERSFERWVVSRCDQKSFDMVFKSGNRSETFLYTPSDWQLMRHCPEPVMIVGDNPWKEGGVILAALDLSSNDKKSLDLNENIIQQANKLAKATVSEIHLCYSVALPSALIDLDLIDYDEFVKRSKNKLDPIIAKLIQDVGIKSEQMHLVTGKPAKEICRISKEINADVVLLGNKTKLSLRGRLMGTTAENILHKVSADVVVIK